MDCTQLLLKKGKTKLEKIVSINWKEKCKIVIRGREENISKIYLPKHK